MCFALAMAHAPLCGFAVYSLVLARKESVKVEKYALAYESALDKDKFLVGVYDEIKTVEEKNLPPHLRNFVIKVKASQFCK